MPQGFEFIENNLVLTNSNSLRHGATRKELSISSNSKELFYLSALRTKPFMLLAGISGTGKSRIVRKLAQATVTKEIQQRGKNGG